MTSPPTKFALMRAGRNRETPQQRNLRIRREIDRIELEMAAEWRARPAPSPRLPRRWLRWPFWSPT